MSLPPEEENEAAEQRAEYARAEYDEYRREDADWLRENRKAILDAIGKEGA